MPPSCCKSFVNSNRYKEFILYVTGTFTLTGLFMTPEQTNEEIQITLQQSPDSEQIYCFFLLVSKTCI